MKAIKKVLLTVCTLVVAAAALTGCCATCSGGACHGGQTESVSN